jgi:hypothetical protein
MDSEHRRQSEPEEVYQSGGEVAPEVVLIAGRPVKRIAGSRGNNI